MRIGIDSYSYHRLLGEIRPGETEPPERWNAGDVIDHARTLGVDGVSLETCFLDRDSVIDPGGLELVIAWGHRHGLEDGGEPPAAPASAPRRPGGRPTGCGPRVR